MAIAAPKEWAGTGFHRCLRGMRRPGRHLLDGRTRFLNIPNFVSVPSIQIAEKSRWLLCPECGASCLDRDLPRGTELRCGRCGVTVRRQSDGNSLQAAWAFATAGLFFAVLANVQPILTFDVAGNTQSNLIVTGVSSLFDQGYWPVASLIFFAGIAGPLLHLSSVWYVTSASCLDLAWPGLRWVAKFAEAMETWNLVPVYAVATVVAVVKLDMLGTVASQHGALRVVALSLCSLLTMQCLDRDLLERRLEELA